MPIHHFAALKLKTDKTDDDKDTAVLCATTMHAHMNGGKIPGVLQAMAGKNFTDRAGGRQLGVDIVLEKYEDLKTYGPHEEHLKVKAVVGPNLESMLVIDFEDEGIPAELAGETLCNHASPRSLVMIWLKIREDAVEADVAKMELGLRGLTEKIDTVRFVRFGKNLTPGRADGFTHGLLVALASAEELPTYAAHPYHQQVAKELIKPLLQEGGLMALDITVTY